ncbi:MAG TPA: ATP-binding protein [Candidatus Sulfotelmatobacter sp.]|nr:ATP-binding protein [Candidatus Sulfotelmatobacter sp.]
MTDSGFSGIFLELDPPELEALRGIAQERTFPAGARIFSENDPGDGVYVIRDGLVEIAHLIGDRALCVFSKFGPGDIFGEMAVIEDRPRSATTIAVKDTSAYFIPRAQMTALLRRSPALSFKLLQEISRRLRDFNQHHLREVIEAERLVALGNFARSIVHDLKNPLTVIGMASEIMAAPQSNPERRKEYYDRVKRQIGAITELVGDILDFTQAATPQSQLAAISYKEFIEDLAVQLRLEAEFRDAVLKVENDPPAVELKFDPRRLRRVIVNLTGNALDMKPEGDGQVTVRFKQTQNEIITEVQDNGPGIAPEIAGKLFQAFATFGKEHGTGLGLSICKKIVEDHGGRIWAHNVPAPDHGAIFSFALPLPKTG